MRLYTIHVPRRPWSSITTVVAATVAVKDGFSWPAFFFSFLWALTQRLWLVALVLFAVEMLLMIPFTYLDGATEAAGSLGVMLVLGWIGNDLKRRGLEKRGLEQHEVVLADSAEAAVRRYFSEMSPRDGYVS
jgi:hypothetical protein